MAVYRIYVLVDKKCSLSLNLIRNKTQTFVVKIKFEVDQIYKIPRKH